ncbi:DNA recombination protein RmuC [Saccharibacter sp. 17.LH.SD]|nr:DNA recombination protein RmuC [Saccharibacter sp. 17.LH.SD]
MSQDLSVRLAALERISSELSASFRDEAHISRDDARQVLANQTHMMDRRLNELSTFQSGQLSSMRKEASDHRARLEESIQRHVDNFSHTQTTQLKATNDALRELSDRLTLSQEKGVQTQKEGLQAVTERIGALMETHSTAQEKLRDTVSGSLERLQKDNADKLERMRATVEEKLQGTLEKRLGESFQLVSDRLEQVHKGLGEMQTLATGVGDLKRVLTNVKSRGGWGEVQLGMLLDDMLTREQYESNVKVLPGSDKLVDYAVKLPGNSQPDEPLWLPIDAKFPHEDYERLLQAQDTGNPEEIERYSSALEKAVRLQAKSISEKYIHPPHTTDFAIMYLPTEGLFAEVIRRPGLARDLQATYRIMIQGPTTLSALLTSLQMGFRTLAIEKRSSEVWQVLGAAKSEFMKYGQVWERLGKQLDTAKRTVEEAGKRTRAVERKLRDVELLEEPDESSNILDFMAKGDEENPFSS